MSEATKLALDAAIAAHVADECDGGIVSGYVLQTAYFNGDTIDRGMNGYLREFAEGQAWHAGYGLALHLADYFRAPEYEVDDDDD